MTRKSGIRGGHLNNLNDPAPTTAPMSYEPIFFHGCTIAFYLKPNYTKYESSHNYENLKQQSMWVFVDLILFPQVPNSLFYSNV